MDKELLKNFTILYVEDEEMVRKNAVEYLQRLAKEVYEAKDGKEAIKIWSELHPDIIITDISMPKLNGLDMAAYIRSKDTKTQIIVATAHTDTEYLMKAVELQLVKYLTKPITKDKLLNALQMGIDKIEDKSKFSIYLSKESSYNAYTHTLKYKDKEIQLTNNEALFMNLLSSHNSRIVSYEEIENAIWPYDGMSSDAIRSLVRGLRKKLQVDVIKNISGSGYKLSPLT